MPPMFSSISSYIWGDVADEAAAAEPNTAAARRSPSPRKCKLKTTAEDNEWVLVESSSRSMGSSVETGSMEDLLIEHPSMSVYQSRGHHSAEDLDSSDAVDAAEPTVASVGASARHPPRRPRAIAQRAGLAATQIGAIASRCRTRAMTSSSLSRKNKVVDYHQSGKHAARRGRILQPGARNMRHC